MTTQPSALHTSNIASLPLLARGKVRDNYAVGDDRILMVASDRLSAFDVIMGEPIPGKGVLLTQMALFWFDKLGHICPNHLTGESPESVVKPEEVKQVQGRSMLVKRLKPVLIEAVVRGYLAGSGWQEYKAGQAVCGVPLPAGLTNAAKLPEPIYTPAAKAEMGDHDENITYERTVEMVGEKLAAQFGADTMRLADLPEHLHEYDAIISCTASTLPIIGLGAVESALKKRKRRPIFMVDLAVPRDIEAEVKHLNDVYLYTVDDLATVVRTGQAHRQAAVEQAEVIIDTGVQSFMSWLDQRNPVGGTVALIQQVNAQADEWRALEIARAKKLLAKGEDIDTVLEALSRGLTQKMLHGTMAQLHKGDADQRAQTADTVARLFLRPGRNDSGSQNSL
ncbi:MAG: phosphoribosylaminoimidazolesuccinocarboxamide synthase [Comamonas sp.]